MRFFKRLFCGFVLLASASAQAQTGLQNQELLEKSGITNSVNAIPAAMQEGIEQARQQNPAIDAKFVRAWHVTAPVAYRPEKILQIIDKGLQNELSADEKRQLMVHYDSPLGKHITDLENAAVNASAEAAAYGRNPSAYADRVDLYKELDKESGASDIGVAVMENMSVALQLGILTAAKEAVNVESLKAEIAKARPQLVQQSEQEIISMFAYTYRSLSKDEVKTYIAFMKTPAARKFNKALGKLLSDAISGQTNELGQLLIKNLQSGAPT